MALSLFLRFIAVLGDGKSFMSMNLDFFFHSKVSQILIIYSAHIMRILLILYFKQ